MSRKAISGVDGATPSATSDIAGILTDAGQIAAPGRAIILFLQTARTLFRLGFFGAAALFVGQSIMGGAVGWAAEVAVGCLFVSIVLSWTADDRLAVTETEVAIGVRDRLKARLQTMQARAVQLQRSGTLIVGLQRHPEAIAALLIGHGVSSRMMIVGPVLAAATLLFVSWRAALLIVTLTPVMVVFFVLVGDKIHRRADLQEQAFGRLAGQFADRIRALPTILANHAIAEESAKLRERLESYAASSVGVLRIAFLNAALIDFFASLSIAMLAVLLGLGHLKLVTIPGFGGLELWQSLFILMIAPEYFAPFRRYAEQYHAKAEGVAAANAIDDYLGAKAPAAPALLLSLPYLECQDLPLRGLVAIKGPSGSGKTTMLRRLAGIEVTEKAQVASVNWIGSESYIPAGTLAEAIGWNAGSALDVDIAGAAVKVGLTKDAWLPDGLETILTNGGDNLSGGQRLRISLARAVVGHWTVMADEPTAKLDAVTATMVRFALCEMAVGRLVVVATHDAMLLRLADVTIDLGSSCVVEIAA